MLWESAQRRTTAGTCWAGLAAIRGQQPAIHCSPPLQCLLPACSFGADCHSQKCCLSNGSTCLPQDNSTFIPDNFAALPGVGLIVSKLCCSGVCDLTTKACTDVSMSVGVAGALQTSPRLGSPSRSCAPPPPLPFCRSASSTGTAAPPTAIVAACLVTSRRATTVRAATLRAIRAWLERTLRAAPTAARVGSAPSKLTSPRPGRLLGAAVCRTRSAPAWRASLALFDVSRIFPILTCIRWPDCNISCKRCDSKGGGGGGGGQRTAWRQRQRGSSVSSSDRVPHDFPIVLKRERALFLLETPGIRAVS